LPRFDKYALQTLGFGLTLIGLILLFISLLTGGPESCPATGCVLGVFFWYDVVRNAAFFSSVAFIVLGILLIIVARLMKPTMETNTVADHGAPNE
jgi:thiosulfate reductase cytochrome b subunit